MSLPPDTPVSSGPVNEPSLKRRRVAQACQNCRIQKSKCNGQHPVCNRCEGYGHTCVWAEDKKSRFRRSNSKSTSPTGSKVPEVSPSSISTPSVSSLHVAVQSYEKLIKSVRLDLPDSSRAAVDLTLSYIRIGLPSEVIGSRTALGVPAPTSSFTTNHNQDELPGSTTNNQRYLGEASDVRFYYTVKKILQDGDVLSGGPENDIQSYDQGLLHLERHDRYHVDIDLPRRDLADEYIDIYFSTIHIAYPFICRSSFMELYNLYWKGDSEVDNTSWLPLLYTIFAIGAYYTSFPRSENIEVLVHLQYFKQAVSLSGSVMTDCTLDNIHLLLALCFFLLATGQTDRCWNTLGLAVRVAQSIGLHVEDPAKQIGPNSTEHETKRRTWYSLYVLDQLLALQLGRPVAIRQEDYRVNLPSEAVDCASDLEELGQSSWIDCKPLSIDYFVSVIKFSRILGQVISDLYKPSQVTIDPDRMLLNTAKLDEKLIEWKLNLPRHLRFDLGHTFEKSVIFKRQRNMLAIKFHHLRTLMHRPYLCLEWLQRHNQSLMGLLDRAHDRVNALEKICVFEAQQTAHLLHNVADERSLVHDFPWWQMISCLLCASSVLLVARSCIEPNEADAKLQAQALDEDAETCLKVFDALSVNSDAARRARDMMKGLKRTRILPRGKRAAFYKYYNADKVLDGLISGPSFRLADRNTTDNGHEMAVVDHNVPQASNQDYSYSSKNDPSDWQTWPGELSDPMLWSAQFIDSSQNMYFNAVPVSDIEGPMYAPFSEGT